MPYSIEMRDGQHCIVKEGGETVACHETHEQAEEQMRALYASEKKALDDPRLMVLVTSNAYQDRQQEIVRQKALEAYVESSWDGAQFAGRNELDLWHSADPIGEIVFAEMQGPFLIEVAKELSDRPVNLARTNEPPYLSTVKAVWDAIEQSERAGGEWGASQEFIYAKPDQEDGVYEWILKRRTSALPRQRAANGYTFSHVIRSEL